MKTSIRTKMSLKLIIRTYVIEKARKEEHSPTQVRHWWFLVDGHVIVPFFAFYNQEPAIQQTLEPWWSRQPKKMVVPSCNYQTILQAYSLRNQATWLLLSICAIRIIPAIKVRVNGESGFYGRTSCGLSIYAAWTIMSSFSTLEDRLDSIERSI